jgi:hypothetical protein
MRRLFKVPLVFLFIALLLGLLLRWHFVEPVSGLKFPYWLHGHSHMMFLGWVFNTLFLAFAEVVSPDKKRYVNLFVFVQVLLVGMMISFPLQGYGAISITLSTLHTLSIFVFSAWIFRDTKGSSTLSTWFARRSLFFFLLSSLGPFTLGPLVANGLGQSHWYYFAVYYYLHFQYNGVFLFGILSLIFRFLEEKKINVDVHRCRRASAIMFWSVFPCYALSLLWAKPGMFFNFIGLGGGILQIIAVMMLFKAQGSVTVVWSTLKRRTKPLLVVAGLSFVLKLLLQLLSSHQAIANLAYEIRPFTIAYLHLVLIGVVTFALLAWYHEQKIISLKNPAGVFLLIVGFAASELTMIAGPLCGVATPLILFVFSSMLVAGILITIGRFVLTRLNT